MICHPGCVFYNKQISLDNINIENPLCCLLVISVDGPAKALLVLYQRKKRARDVGAGEKTSNLENSFKQVMGTGNSYDKTSHAIYAC